MHVVLVEDDEACRLVVASALVRSGARVTSVASGAAALEILNAGVRPDLLLTDIHLPGDCDGWLIARLYQDEWPDLPVVYITGTHASSDQVNNSVYLRKPVRPALLVRAVHALLSPRVEHWSRQVH